MTNKYQRGACQCARCQRACTKRPGWFAPDQIVPLAQAMGLTPQELFKQHLQVDYWVSGQQAGYFALTPRLEGAEGGTLFPVHPFGTCHWFVEGKCQVHDLGKPHECADMHHRPDGSIEDEGTRDTFSAPWCNPEAQQLIRDLYGSEPAVPPMSLLDIISIALHS